MTFANVPKQRAKLQIGLFEKDRPILFGMSKERDDDDGYYNLCDVKYYSSSSNFLISSIVLRVNGIMQGG